MKELDLRDLDAFVAVARTRNFRRAALEQRVSVSSLSQRLRDMEERFGAGVRYAEHLAQGMIAVPLSPPQRYAVVASPDYVARLGKPKHPKDLLDHRCIRIRFGRGALLDWEFEKAGQVVKVSPAPRLI